MEQSPGQQIKGRRKALRLTQAELARRAGVSRATLIAVGRGEVARTDVLHLVVEGLGARLALERDVPGPENSWTRPEVQAARRKQRFPDIYELIAANRGLLMGWGLPVSRGVGSGPLQRPTGGHLLKSHHAQNVEYGFASGRPVREDLASLAMPTQAFRPLIAKTLRGLGWVWGAGLVRRKGVHAAPVAGGARLTCVGARA